MKKLFLIYLSTFLSIASMAIAQNSASTNDQTGSRIRLGLAIAPTFNWLNTTDVNIETNGIKLGFGYGLIVDYRFTNNERYFLTTGIWMQPAKGKYTQPHTLIVNGDTTQVQLERNVRVQNLTIPVGLKLKTNPFGKFVGFGVVGFSPSFAVHSRYSEDPTNIKNQPAKSFVKVPNLWLNLGGGVEYNISENTALFAGLYYDNGFMKIIKDGDGLKPADIAIRVGVMF